MTSKIFIGTLLFMIIFAATGLVLLNEGVLPDQEREGTGRMQIEARAQAGRSIEAGALIFLSNCATCHGSSGEGVPGKGPSLMPGVFDHFEELRVQRLFNGTLLDYIKSTVAAGRPVLTTYAEALGGFAAPMPTWGQEYGGPLRTDQVNDVSHFVLNWEEEWKSGPAVPSDFTPVGSDLTVALPAGDAARGQELFLQNERAGNNSRLPCKACHSLNAGEALVGPSLAGIGTRAATREPGKTADQYLRESIQHPNAFIVPDDPKFQVNGKSTMPEGLGNSMTAQDLADILAYLATLQ